MIAGDVPHRILMCKRIFYILMLFNFMQIPENIRRQVSCSNELVVLLKE